MGNPQKTIRNHTRANKIYWTIFLAAIAFSTPIFDGFAATANNSDQAKKLRSELFKDDDDFKKKCIFDKDKYRCCITQDQLNDSLKSIGETKSGLDQQNRNLSFSTNAKDKRGQPGNQCQPIPAGSTNYYNCLDEGGWESSPTFSTTGAPACPKSRQLDGKDKFGGGQ
jgi:hypothetical protein